MCTVLVRFRPDAAWPVLMAAVRDEFLARAWDPPARHWAAHPSIVGGRDRQAGGTWLAVDSARPAVAAVLNGLRLPPEPGRPSRGELPLAALAGRLPTDFAGYDGFHLVHATPSAVTVLSWNGVKSAHHQLTPGDHIIVNDGVDAIEDPLVPHFAPLFAALPDPPLLPGAATEPAWDAWVGFLRGGGLPADDPRALLIRHEHDGHVYGSGSLALVGLAPNQVRYDFTPTPFTPQWTVILPPSHIPRSTRVGG